MGCGAAIPNLEAAAAVLDLSREGHQGGLAQKELKLAEEALRFS